MERAELNALEPYNPYNPNITTMKTLKGCEEMRRREAEKVNNSPPETLASSAEILTCNDWIGALAKDMEREEDAAWVAVREADRKDDLKEYNNQLATARTWKAAVRKLRSKMESAPNDAEKRRSPVTGSANPEQEPGAERTIDVVRSGAGSPSD